MNTYIVDINKQNLNKLNENLKNQTNKDLLKNSLFNPIEDSVHINTTTKNLPIIKKLNKQISLLRLLSSFQGSKSPSCSYLYNNINKKASATAIATVSLDNINNNKKQEEKPVTVKSTLIYQYLTKILSLANQPLSGFEQKLTNINISQYTGIKKGSFIQYNKIIGYNFNNYPNLPISPSPSLQLQQLQHYYIGQTDSNATFLDLTRARRGNESSKYIKDSYKLLLYFFKSMYGLISKPVYKFTSEKVIIQLFYYLNIPKKKVLKLFAIYYIKSFKKLWFLKRSQHNTFRKNIFNRNSLNKFGKPKRFFVRWKLRKAISRLKSKKTNIKLLFFNLRKFNLSKVFYSKFKLICDILSNKFKKPVQLELTRLHYPYYDSNILVNLLYLNIKNKRKKSRVAIQKIYNKKAVKKLNDPNLKSINNIPAFLSGLNIKIAGRLMREPMIPRLTTKIYENGATATGKVNYLDIATITKKNRKGAYTIKITSGQNFFK